MLARDKLDEYDNVESLAEEMRGARCTRGSLVAFRSTLNSAEHQTLDYAIACIRNSPAFVNTSQDGQFDRFLLSLPRTKRPIASNFGCYEEISQQKSLSKSRADWHACCRRRERDRNGAMEAIEASTWTLRIRRQLIRR
jgi:hypothetical protein